MLSHRASRIDHHCGLSDLLGLGRANVLSRTWRMDTKILLVL